MPIQIKTVRIAGFRGLANIEVNLEKTTVLIGMNNAGKTSFLKALQIAFGDARFVNEDDFHIDTEGKTADDIAVDVLMVPMDADGKRTTEFDRLWINNVFRRDIALDVDGNEFAAFRSHISRLDDQKRFYPAKAFLKEWPDYSSWRKSDWVGNSRVPNLSEFIPFLFQDAQRDITEDLKLRTSPLGRVLSKVKYDRNDMEALQGLIDELNVEAVDKSDVLKSLQTHLSELGHAVGNRESKTEITPFAKQVRDLTKGIRLNYQDGVSSFSMEYHGMGTRSWASLLVIKSFVKILDEESAASNKAFLPILALEEPEAHLHPNAQKQLYRQMCDFPGQVIISTHSPYIAAQAEIGRLRSFYKTAESTIIGVLPALDHSKEKQEEKRRIEREVMNTRGELLFSKMLVLFEGETEEQALPIFFEKYFGQTPFGCGVNFIGVSGSGNYKPFLQVAKSFNIQWLIFSDGEDNALKTVRNAISAVYDTQIDPTSHENVVVIPKKLDYEGYLLDEGYQPEIESGIECVLGNGWIDNQIKKSHGTKGRQQKTDQICSACKQPIYEGPIRDYSGVNGRLAALNDFLNRDDLKTKITTPVAKAITKRTDERAYPPKVKELLDKISSGIFLKEVDDG